MRYLTRALPASLLRWMRERRKAAADTPSNTTAAHPAAYPEASEPTNPNPSA